MTTDAQEPAYRLYRHFDDKGVLLYVGLSRNIRQRTKAHEKFSSWWEEIESIKVTKYHSFDELQRAEVLAIKSEKPKYNKVHNVTKDNIAKSKAELKKRRKPMLEVTVDDLTLRLIEVPLMIKAETATEISNITGFARAIVRSALDDGALASTLVPNKLKTGATRYVSGWQLLDWLESLGAAA